MPNTRRDTVGYRRLELPNTLAEGLLAIDRPGGDLERRVAAGLFRLADHFGGVADQQAAYAGKLAGEQAALSGAPTASTISDAGGSAPEIPAGKSSGYDLASHLTDQGRMPDLQGIDPGFRNKLATMIENAPPEIRPQIQLLSGYRSVERQGKLYAAALKKYGSEKAARKWVAPPGHSQHNHGNAYDLRYGSPAAQDWVHQNAARFGLNFPLGNEPWHIEPLGARGGQTPPPPRPGVPLESQPPGVVATGHGGTFRPSRRNTVFGRAYDAAGTQTYLQMADATMQQDMANVYEHFKDDPAGLRQGLDALYTLHTSGKEGFVFPEIAADYQVAFTRRRIAYELQADKNAENRRIAQDQASFIDRTNELNTLIQRQQAAISADNPMAPAMILESQVAIDNHYDDAVARKLMSPDAAEKAKIETKREAALGFYSRQAETLDARGISEMRASMETDFAKGDLPGLDGAGWQQLDTWLKARERQKQTEDKQANAAYSDRGDMLIGRIAAGFDVSEADLSQFQLDAKTAPKGEDIRNSTLTAIATARAIRDLPLGEAQQKVDQMRADLGKTPSEEAIKHFQLAQSVLAKKRDILATDPIGFAENAGIVERTPSIAEAQDAGELAQIVSSRVMNGQLIADHFGVPARYFRPGEAAALKKMVAADPAQAAQLAGAIVSGAGGQVHAVLRELGDAAPEVLQAGAIIAEGGSAEAAVDAIAGQNKKSDGKAYKAIDTGLRRETEAKAIGNALVFQPADATRISDAANAIARKRLDDAGVEADSKEGRAIYARAINEAAGAVYDKGTRFGGFQRVRDGWLTSGAPVLVDNRIRADRFEDVIRAVQAADLAALPVQPVRADGKPLPAGYLNHAMPVAVRGGYAFAMGDPEGDDPQFVKGSDGKPFVLDLAGMADVLAPRVPGAFRGR